MHVSLTTRVSPVFRVWREVDAMTPPTRPSPKLVASLARRDELWWWEFESDIKRQLALEILMRKMFAMTVAT
jgi:hypothetical protein